MIALSALLCAGGLADAAPATAPAAPRAEVLHWWTSGGESAAVRTLADAYRAAGGIWLDTAIAGSEQARAVALSRIAGGDPPTAALFNASRQFRDLIDQGLLNDVDAVAEREHWSQFLPAVLLDTLRVNGHYYAAPVSIHMPTWIWYSKAAFRKAGIAAEPRSFADLFAALDKLKAAGLIPLAHGGQAWQDNIVFRAVLANEGGADLYLRILRDRDPRAIASPEFRRVLLTFRRLHAYVDAGSPGRNWNDATALLITGRAGVQIMGDWVKAEFASAQQNAGRDYGCIAGFGPRSPYIVQGDAFIFPKSADPQAPRAQQLLAATVTSGAAQLAFSSRKGSIPVRADIDASTLDYCARLGVEIMKDKSRQLGNDEAYLTPDQNGAMADVLTDYWNRERDVAQVQKSIAAALRD
ncbi:MAG: carbohydrate ABC transporter substrate-binding protein [Gammaproteobacteria bacterium]|nr:carbohydrate ABC transporter substrate-binding protein [Gammaproteobacteria bacterium]MDE2251688.1 carbohydrate ABC transporter substrate-binding protein [Gammaproteobacteria bacterium]